VERAGWKEDTMIRAVGTSGRPASRGRSARVHGRVLCLCAVTLALVLWTHEALHATVVASASLDDLVAEARSIFVGEVVDVRSFATGPPDDQTVRTEVIFSVDRVLKGEPRAQARLEFLGGRAGESRVEVAGVPRFRVGDRDVLFVERETGLVSALVGVAQGRFRLVRDPQTGEERVAFHDFRPVTDVAAIGARRTAAATPARALSLRTFEEAIRARIARPQ
jgi:hypothetical protein